MARTDGTSSNGTGHQMPPQGTPGGAGGEASSGADAGKVQHAKKPTGHYGSTGSKPSGGSGSSQSSGGGHGGQHG